MRDASFRIPNRFPTSIHEVPTMCITLLLLGSQRLLSLRILRRTLSGPLRQGQPPQDAAEVQERVGTEQPDRAPRAPGTLRWEPQCRGRATGLGAVDHHH